MNTGTAPSPPPMQLSVCFAREAVPDNRWITHRWSLVGMHVGSAPPPLENQVVVSGLTLTLHGEEADGYYMNVTADEPSLFFMVRPSDDSDPDSAPTVIEVSANFYEASRWMDSGEAVERLPLPADWARAIEAFARDHYKAPEKKARKRYARTGDHHGRPGH
ncbi:DUF3305 domain-containing protein [Nitrogeniibacter mangrovi]|uniref:DUF3305 domain-containing protein n=1 Tax=Nitrogeniibacter mangrovi TaxID=2016596 RepID=A0A6C1B287_9RHOO|nr:DUF3305 domain-containing protein [Nitrogeniibacter mangrovi]QID16324.1 DUF3305 domain-containing protein [Nitrogeniibacter mangrovi]